MQLCEIFNIYTLYMHYLLIDSYTDAMPVQKLYRCLALIASEFTNTVAKPDNHKLSTL